MSTTNIEWTDATWNPVTGCTKISPGCKNCYAERMAKRLAGRFGYPAADPFKVTLHPERLREPLKWRKPHMVFPCSMGDLFHEDVPEEFINEIITNISLTPEHTYQVLTKRPERMLEVMGRLAPRHTRRDGTGWPLSNLWLGVTAEDQKRADERIPVLLQIPAAVRFVSVEPILGGLDIRAYLPGPTGRGEYCPGLDWVICGGETGPGHRDMHTDWARSLRDQCSEAGVPFFFKRMAGGWPPPDDLMVRQMPEVTPND